MRKAVTRVNHLYRHFAQPRRFASTKMADLNIDTKYKMLSGHDIPALGYGVSRLHFYVVFLGQIPINTNIYETGQSLAVLRTRSDHALISMIE